MDFTFAELLRSFRRRASLDQSALAAGLGVHLNTVSAWERGLYLPKDRDLVLRLAEELSLAPAEADQLLRAAEFPAVHGTPRPVTARHQLRAPIADFVGRSSEAGELRAALQATLQAGSGALVSGVRGMGGIGKTELAYYVAHDLRGAFPDAQIMLDLRGSSPAPLLPEQALQTIIRTFTPEAKLPVELSDLQRLYCSLLYGKRALILADDARDASQVRPLVPPAGCALLVTSRQRFVLPGMTVVDLEQMGEAEAIAVLSQSCPRLSPDEARALAHACGGLPLALRISAGILLNDPALSVDAYLASLKDDRRCLAALRDPDDELLDIEASIALSYDLLDPPARLVFRQLGVPVADFTTDLAETVAAGEGTDVAEMLRRLLRRNLVQYEPAGARWRLHDLVRAFALRRLQEAGELEPAQWCYAQAALRIAQETQEQYLAGGDGVLVALARFDVERPHIDAGLHWAALHTETPPGDQLLRDYAVATAWISPLRYDVRRERIPQWELACAAAQRLGDRQTEGLALNELGNAYVVQGEIQQAVPYYEQSLAAARAAGDQRSEGRALSNLGVAYYYLGKLQRAISYFEQGVVSARAVGDRRNEGLALHNLGGTYAELGDLHSAILYYEQDLAIAREQGDRHGEGQTLYNLGQAYATIGDTRRAIEYCETSLAILRAIGNRRTEGYALSYLAYAQARHGDLARATEVFEQAVVCFREVGDRRGEAEGQWQLGLALAEQGARGAALPLLRAAVAYEQEVGHAQAAEHQERLARLEAEDDTPPHQREASGC